jgi:hypothetical protein
MIDFLLRLWYHNFMKNQFMHESTLDLFCDQADAQMAEEYTLELEAKAAELEVTVDYYMSEFL